MSVGPVSNVDTNAIAVTTPDADINAFAVTITNDNENEHENEHENVFTFDQTETFTDTKPYLTNNKNERQQRHDNDDDDEDDNDWSSSDANPLMWPSKRKWKSLLVVSLYTFVSPLASSMMAPALPAIADHYHITNPTISALTLSIFLLAYSLGPLVISPLSEIYGRVWVLHISNIVFLLFCIGCIFAPNTASLIVFRFLAGIGGSTPVAIGGSVISDVFVGEQRGTAMSIYSIGPLIGPGLGPVIGGFIVQTIGFKWIFILLTLLAAAASLIGIPLLEETYQPILKARYLALKRNHDGDIESTGSEKTSSSPSPPMTKPNEQQQRSASDTLLASLSRPFVLLTRSLICFMLSLYMALIYGYLYLMFTTFPDLYSTTYGWSPGISGLAYLGTAFGFIISTLVGVRMLSKSYLTLTERNNGISKPEFRIPVMFLGSLFVPVGLFWYGWSAQAKTTWIMPIIGTAIFGAGQMFVFIPLQLYLVDSFTYAASALGAASVFRALFAFIFPLFGEQMFQKLGFGGGNSLLAGLAIVTGVPFPIFLWFKGEQVRLRNPLNR